MAVLRRLLENFITDERGLETVEFAIMTAVIVAGLVVAVGMLAGAAGGLIGSVATAIGLL
jgi:Flp pilus assembly pilin Flp